MFNHRKFRPGSYISIAPLGLLCTLVYDDRGILSKILPTLDARSEDECLDWKVTTQLIEKKVIPQRIHFCQGTTYVEGVFYTSQLIEDCGDLPHCISNEILHMLETSSDDITFYAGNLRNSSIKLTHHNTVTTRLKTCGFKTLPGCVQYEESEIKVKEILQYADCKFNYPNISGCFVFESNRDTQFFYAGTSQHKVKQVNTDFDEHGFLISEIVCDDISFFIDYSYVVSFNIQPGSLLMLDSGEVLSSIQTDKRRKSALTRDLTCKICGKKYKSALSGHTFCPDPHCSSRLYSQLNQFIKMLDISDMSFDEAKPLIESGELCCISDLFLLDRYKNTQVETTMSKLLAAIIPLELYRDKRIFQEICAKTVTPEAFMYYVDNPEHISSDLGVVDSKLSSIVDWLSDPHNNLLIKTLMSISNIDIVSGIKKFRCAPIFRGKKISICGYFVHGGTEDIISILNSYYAEVVLDFDRTSNMVVIGDRSVENSTEVVELCNAYNIPVYTESDFFSSFEIDNDLKRLSQ